MWERVLRSWIQTAPSRAAACFPTPDPHPRLSTPPCSTVQTWGEAAEQVRYRRVRQGILFSIVFDYFCLHGGGRVDGCGLYCKVASPIYSRTLIVFQIGDILTATPKI
jgi:hypothetical protein